MRLRIAARRSALARIQAQLVARSLREKFENLAVEFYFRESLGDRNQDQPLWQMPEKGVFTEDLRAELLNGKCDLVVHSWKDLPVESGPETAIVATLPRADARDLLLIRGDRWQAIERTGTILLLTASPRRVENLQSFLPDALPAEIRNVRFLPVRGNIQTRVNKMWREEADGLVLAKAALDRLLQASSVEFSETVGELRQALVQCRWMILPLAANPSAPAQGALAVEIAAVREDLRRMLSEINCPATFSAVEREREILRDHGGGCHQAIGVNVLIRPYGEITIVRGRDEGGRPLSRMTLESFTMRPERVDRSLLWPQSGEENEWYSREGIEAIPPGDDEALWIARADALPEHWTIRANRIVWTSGLQTWRRLARRGVWVNGSAEGLGEQESPGLDTLVGHRPNWVKLSHDDAEGEPGRPAVPTYRLIPRSDDPDLRSRRYFFWTSGSIFKRALDRNPWLREMTHFCGPGNTLKALREAGIEPHIFLDHRQWLAEMSL